jgi:hypothetical protein
MGFFGKSDEEKRSEELQDVHNDGQRDGANNQYNDPHSDGLLGLGAFLRSEEEDKRVEEDREAYREGFDNGWKSK